MGQGGGSGPARVRVWLPLEWAGGALSRLVALVQAQKFAERAARERGRPVGVAVVWSGQAQPEASLWLLNRHLMLTPVRLDGAAGRPEAALRGQLEQLLPAGPERGPSLELFLPREGEGQRAAAERLWSAWFPGLGFESGPDSGAALPSDPPSAAGATTGAGSARAAEPGAEAAVLADFGFVAGARPLPRVFLISAATARALERLGLSLDGALAAPLAEGERAPPGPPPPVVAELRALGQRLRGDLAGLRAALSEVDRGLGVQSRRTAAQAEDLLENLARRAERVHQNRAGTRRRHQRRASNALWPLGRPQIEVLSSLQYAALFGRRLLERLQAGLDPESTAIQALELEPPSAAGNAPDRARAAGPPD